MEKKVNGIPSSRISKELERFSEVMLVHEFLRDFV